MALNTSTGTDSQRAARARELYNRLPEVYRARDWQRALTIFGEEAVRQGEAVPELEAFLSIVADEILLLRAHIGDLWDDFFIETCAEWVVPYIADMLGVRLVFNAAQRNRVEVQNTVEWRRRKGTLPMLADLAGAITGWNAAAVEFFETLGWAQHLGHIKLDHLQAPALRDPYQLSLLGTARDPWLHAVDVRRPQGRQGWYNIKNTGFFLSRLNAYPLWGVTPSARTTPAGCFSFDPLGRDVPLFNQANRQPVTAAEFARDPYACFGQPQGFSIRQHGVLVATDRPPVPEQTEIGAFWSGFGPANVGAPSVRLAGNNGLQLVQPELFETPMRRFKITAWWGSDFIASPVTLGTLVTYPSTFVRTNPATAPGVFMLSLELDTGSDAALFPACVLAIRNDRTEKRVADSRDSRYRDALYVYLPDVALAAGEVLNLYVAADGSTFYAHRTAPHLGPADLVPGDLLNPDLDRTLRARAGLGQCFPTRRLTYSLEPSDVVDLHRTAGLRLTDEALFQSAHRQFLIEAWAYEHGPGDLIGQLPTYDDPDPDPAQALIACQYKPNLEAIIREGTRLVLKVSRGALSTDTFFPMTDLVLTDRRGRALLIALPEMDFATNAAPVWLFFDSDGATYYASDDFGHDTALARPERGAALRFDPADVDSGLARKSTGQVLTLSATFPLRHREPVYANLCHWDYPKPRPPRSAQIALDPVRGRFCFATGEAPMAPLDPRQLGHPFSLSADYHEGFTHDVGALTYDRYVSLKAPEHPQPTSYVARSGDANGAYSPVYATLAAALAAARDGEVIQIEDSATYPQNAALVIPAAVQRLVIQSANRQRPCLHFTGGAQFQLPGAMDALRLNGLLISGAPLVITDAGNVRRVELLACSFDPAASGLSLVAGESATSMPVTQVSLCRCIVGGLRLGRGVAELVVTDTILDRPGETVIGDLAGGEARAMVQLERVTAWGVGQMRQLYASECLFVDTFTVGDRQAGCVRYTRYQVGSHLPRRFRCVPAENDPQVDPVTPAFNSHRFGRPDYAQLHDACPDAISAGAENGAEMGVFHGALTTLRQQNLVIKLQEYLPVGLTPAIIRVT